MTPLFFYNLTHSIRHLVRDILMLLGALVIFSLPALADNKVWTDPATGFAVGGYDVVSFWSSEGPAMGTQEFEVRIDNITWRFANRGNCLEFLKHPEVYAPQFSGYGVYAISQGNTPRGNPLIWSIAGGKLYFFYSVEARRKWVLAREGFLAKARRLWPELRRRIANLS